MAGAEWTVERHLLGKPQDIITLYHRFIELAEACGPFTYSVTKSAITLKGARRGFAGARPGTRALGGYLDLQRRVDDPRITRSSPYTGRLYVHQFRVSAPGELDEEFAGWVHEAYQVGNGAHLGRRSAPTVRDLLQRALGEALKARDMVAVSALRSALGAIDNASAVPAGPATATGATSQYVAGAAAGLGAAEAARRSLSDQEASAIVQAEIAERQAAARDYDRAGHTERAGRLRRQAGVLAATLAAQS